MMFPETDKAARATAGLADGAIDTLGSLLRSMGDYSFPVAEEADSNAFRDLCDQFACHVENGSPVPAYDVSQTVGGRRQWSRVRRFFVDRRASEQSFVNERLGNYRSIVQDLVDGLRQMGQRDEDTETTVRRQLASVEVAVEQGSLQEIQHALTETIQNVAEVFAVRQAEYKSQIQELNERMSCLREDLVQAQEKMQRDALTATYNRGAFDMAITRALNMHFILNQPVTLIMIDLDNFKSINDSHGHAAGDEALRQVGEALERSFIRKSDFVARYGGDEFAVILADTTGPNSVSLIERFMERVARISLQSLGEPAAISCSVGYTEIDKGDTVAALVKRADSGLYEAKHAGRNCHRFVPPPAALTDS